jgi:hypothetical protein
MQLVPCTLAGMPVAAYGTLLGTLNLTLPSAGEPLAFSPRRCMTCGFEEDRCSPLGAVALLYPPPRCRRPTQAVQIRSAVEFSLVADELRLAGHSSGRR